MLKCALVEYRGRVQGVGFRYTVRVLAGKHAVEGYVKNLTDGAVELLAQGEEAEVRALLDDVDARMGPFIRSRSVDWRPPGGPYRGFDIRF